MFTQQQQNSLFGQPNSSFVQPVPTAFGANPTPGGLFGSKSTSGFGAQTTAPFGSTSTFGSGIGGGVSQINPSPQGAGMFGSNTSFPQNQTNQPIAIGGASTFGQFQQTPGIPQQQIQGGSLGTTDFNKNQANTTSFFGQSASTGAQPTLFGQTGGFGQTSSFQQTPSTGLLGNQFQSQTGQVAPQSQFGAVGLQIGMQPQQKSSFFGQAQPQNLQNSCFPIQQQIIQGQAAMIYQETLLYPQSINTLNQKYNQKQIQTQDSTPQNLIMTNIRADDQFSRPSIQMLRFYDIFALKGQPKENYEYLAMQEFSKNSQQYLLLQKLQAVLNSSVDQKLQKVQSNQLGQQTGFNQQSSFLGGQASQGLNLGGQNQTQLSVGMFNGGAQQQSQSGLFANQSKPITNTGLFNQNQPSVGFNQPSQGIAGTLFNQQQQPAQPTIGGGQGLFGQNQNQTASLFNQPKLTPQPSGLFNQQQPQQTQAGGMFGPTQMQKSPSTSILQPQINVNLGATTGLGGAFGNQPGNQTDTTGLFGQNPAPAANSGGMFQAINPTPSTNSLFQPNKNQSGGSLFAPSQGGNLFQNNPSTLTQQPAGGLFNSQTPQIGQGGLFNTLQSNQLNQTPQQQQQQQNQYNIYDIKDHLDIENSFLKQQNPLELINKEIEELKKSLKTNQKTAEQAKQLDPNHDTVLCGVSIVDEANVRNLFYENQAYLKEEKRQQAKFEQKQSEILQEYQIMRSQIKKYPITQPLYGNNFKVSSRLFQPKVNDQTKPDLSSKNKQNQQENQLRETVIVTCKFEYEDQVYENQIEIHKTRLTTQLINKIVNWLSEEFRFDGNNEDINVYYNLKEKLPIDKTLKEVGIINDCTLKVILKSQVDQLIKETYSQPRETSTQKMDDLNQLVFNDDLMKDQLLPLPPKEGYICEPNYEELKKLTKKQLQKIQDFKVSNQFGSIQWIGETDITNVDLADVITISQSSCEVYDDERHQRIKPEVGNKLNKPAIITLQNIKPKKNQTTVEKEKFLRKSLEDSDAQHISYDNLKFSWTFKVEHFTKFGEQAEDDEMIENAAPSAEVNNVQSQQIEQAIQQNSVQDNQLLDFEMSKEPENQSIQFNNSKQNFIQNTEPIAQKRFHQNTVTSFRPIVFQVPQIINESNHLPNPKQQDDLTEIINKINETNKSCKKPKPIQTERLSNTETIKFLKQIGVKKFNKTSLGNRGICKPCFHPSGNGIIFVKGNSISLQNLPVVKEFKITEVIQKYLKTNQTDYENQFNQLRITDTNNALDQEMADLSTINAVKDQFEDSYFRAFFQNQLRSMSDFLSNSQSVYDFLTDLARSYLKNSQFNTNQKIRYEFYVICMINALFGDPNRQLNSFHKSQKGIDFQLTSLTKQSESHDESSLVTAKKRRNATLEVFRLLCQLEFPVQKQLDYQEIQLKSEDQICQIVLKYLEVGEVRQAVHLLNRKKLTKLSLLVSQSVSNQFAMSFVSNIQNQFKGEQQKIIQFIQGKAPPTTSWEKNFLYSLMYQECHSIQLRVIVDEFVKKQTFKNVESLLWKLLKVYAQVKESDKEINKMEGNLIPNHDPRDFRIRWISQIVLKGALFHLKRNQQVGWICGVHDDYLTTTASSYVYQLLNQNQITQACQVALLITNQQIRKRLFFEILLRYVITDEGENKQIQDICHQLQIPEVFIKTAAAIRLQSIGKQTSQAVSLWIDCNNLNWAEYLLSRMVLPNYLKTTSDLSEIKSYYTQSQLINHKKSNFIDKTMQKLKSKLSLNDWNATLCGVYQMVQDKKKTFNDQASKTKEIKQLYQTLERINQKLCSEQQKFKNDPVIQYLRKDVNEMILAIRWRSSIDTSQSTLSIEGIQRAQALRCCEISMMYAHAELRNNEVL